MPSLTLRNGLILLSLVLHVTNTHQNDNLEYKKSLKDDISRTKRATKKGFFKTLFSVAGEQYQDTRDTFGKVNNLINDNFLPEHQPVVETTTKPSNPNVTTTAAPFKITRSEFNRIIRRNLRGLVRLFNIELQDALNQSKKNKAEYDKQVSKEVSKFL
ncbi:uncharacterized protein LOC115881641 [Sitophilus oryzae]|uniref:Uncharacterized protein LOC115881641 n=1 Tax=Sitophilus oryzae TaxID=7048 RepID=A0A6J2XWC2_SITOR|nr:uncharacterized protein LOC115881641 [Sitophilus oryzae]